MADENSARRRKITERLAGPTKSDPPADETSPDHQILQPNSASAPTDSPPSDAFSTNVESRRPVLVSRYDRADDSPGFLLWQLTNQWQHEVRAALAPLRITHVQFVLLASAAWLSSSNQLMTQIDLARHAHTDVMMTSEVVRTLEGKGYVVRTHHPDDARARVVSVTSFGLDIAQRAMDVVEAVDEGFFARLGDQTSTFRDAMRQLVERYDES